MTEKEAVQFRLQVLARALQLFQENEWLKKELKARRRQADTWRKKYRKLEKSRG